MFDWLWHLRLIDGPIPFVVYFLSAITLIVLVATRSTRRWLVTAVSGVVGAVLGWLISWLVSDVWNTFGVSLSLPTRLWLVAVMACIFIAAASIRGARVWKKVLAALSIILFALMGGIGINADVGEFPALGEVFGKTIIPPAHLPPVSGPSAAQTTTGWIPPTDMPMKGRLGTVQIPATVSHFDAREAIVYLPPAALVRNAPALPVLVMLSGQPGAPLNVVTAGGLSAILDSYAQAHDGLAPIVVLPDQLGAPERNPMCLDSPLGNSASYLTVDVPNWVHKHLRVLQDRKFWAIGGFSQGGTCAIQLGAGYPRLFGGLLDVSGQLVPHRGSTAATIRDAFGGSVARYSAAMPLSLLSAGAPYTDTLAIFVSGQNDARFTPGAVTVARAAAAAGMTVHSITSPGTAHDWHTVQYGLRTGIPLLASHWGLG